MLGLSATEIDIDELAEFGVGECGVDTAVDDRRECISVSLCGDVTLTDVHTGSEECSSESFACVLVDGSQLLGDRLIVGCFKEEPDALKAYRVQDAVDTHTGGEVHASGLFALRLDVRFDFLRSRDGESCAP